MTSDLLIGEIAKKFGLSTQAIRYYEKLGLIESPCRSAKGYRLYSSITVERLQLIQYAQKFGFSLNQIKELLEFANLQDSTVALNKMLDDRLQDLEQQLNQIQLNTKELKQRQQQLNQLITNEKSDKYSVVDNYLLHLFRDIEASLSANNQTANKANRLLELYSTGERDFQAIELIGAELNGAFLCNADFSFAEMMLASLNEVSMVQTKLNRAYLSGVDLIDAYLHQAELINTNLIGADLTQAILTEANLTGCNLGGANLTNADLRGANLTEAVLIGANLTDTNFQGATILGSNFLEANLEGAIFDLGVREKLQLANS
ncbi:pentapeptide repeat-containing protein [Pleurocapsa sp. PCC 7319]|uniref:pentapeptide repeat-containing protein n=1 Tax=Pleurocapsa sp. PCC 7319 TaxID=118161 RepID=UPI00034B783B|nr:pentapeptide repeat-containing protein [Pleurocapsa sp. PCC 7319]